MKRNNAEYESMKDMYETILEKMVKAREKDYEWWSKIRNKYNIEAQTISIDLFAGEIYKTKKE